MNKKYIPIQLTPNYKQRHLRFDVIAGLTLFVMLVPQSMAYAMLAGLPPVMGLYASTIPLLIYAFFASSRHLSVGPVAITSLLVFSGVSAYAQPGTTDYIATVLTLALMVGAIQLFLGLSKAGFIVKFIPQSVMNGYVSAAAIVIGVSQLTHLLGIEIGNYLQVHLLLFEVFAKIEDIQLLTLAIGILSIIGLIVLKKINPRLPNALLVVIASIALVVLFRLHEGGVRIVGDIPTGFPGFAFPNVTYDTIQMLFPMALTIALLGFMESLAIGKTVAAKEHYKIDSNQELRALGLTNMIGSCFHSFPVNGSFSRTAVNYQTGGVTQIASIVTAICVMITLLFFTSVFYYLPNAVLAAIIIVAVYKLIDLKEMRRLFRVKPLEGWIWVTTFGVTLFIGIQWGIIIGAIFTLLLLIKRSAKPNIIQLGYVDAEETFRDIKRYPEAVTSEKVMVLRIDSTLHFANISFLEEKLQKLIKLHNETKWIIIDMSGVNDIDTVSIEKLEEIIDHYEEERNIHVLFANMRGAIRETVDKVGWDVKYKQQQNHLTLEQLLSEKGIRTYFNPENQTIGETKEWVQDFMI
ncbi:SulP family inorganic anion transporter [Halalkalibacter kiskunsagensis]|uniref:SulP family inorganic anion transporter n=1 Tax=Halalkalibacter kiskunsagensis TaxID=1548599 RepID=A0ABV6KG70_9BACI